MPLLPPTGKQSWTVMGNLNSKSMDVRMLQEATSHQDVKLNGE